MAIVESRDGWRIVRVGQHGYIYSEMLEGTETVRHGVTTRHGNFNLSSRTEPDPERMRRNREAAARLFGAEISDLVVPDQVHAAAVAEVRDTDRGKGACGSPGFQEADALVTNSVGPLLCVTIADCLPVFLVDPVARCCGVAHAGWRGTVGGVVGNTVREMKHRFGAGPGSMLAAVGPGICADCFEVGDEVRDAVLEAGLPDELFQPSLKGRLLLDLNAAVRLQLLGAGLLPERISIAPWCTVCDGELFFSHRGEGPMAGRMGAFIRLLPP